MHKRTHARTHACMRARVPGHARTHARTHACTHVCMDMHARTHARTHACMRRCRRAWTRTHACTHVCVDMHARTHARMHARTYAWTCTCARTHTCKHACMHACMQACMDTYACTPMVRAWLHAPRACRPWCPLPELSLRWRGCDRKYGHYATKALQHIGHFNHQGACCGIMATRSPATATTPAIAHD